MSKRLIVIDGTSLIYRAFHAIPRTFTSPTGAPTNAVYGFTVSLRKLLKSHTPEYIVVAFDLRGPTFRHEIYPEYKADRPPMPDELGEQFAPIKEILKALNIAVLELASYEADDIIAAVTRKASAEGLNVGIVTSDKDMYQLVDGSTVIISSSGKEFGPADVEEKFGVPPEAIRDLLALAGDSSDNIPGVPGVGPKTAVKLLTEFGSIDSIYETVESVKSDKLRQRLIDNKELCFLSRRLATLDHSPPMELNVSEYVAVQPDYPVLLGLMKEYGFTRLVSDVLSESEAVGGGIESSEGVEGEAVEAKERAEVKFVTDSAALESLSGAALKSGVVALTLHTVGDDAATQQILGVGLSIDNRGEDSSEASSKESCYYLPIKAETAEPVQEGLLFGASEAEGEDDNVAGEGLDRAAFDRFFTKLLSNDKITKHSDNAKGLHIYAMSKGAEVASFGIDTTIASYLLDPASTDHSVEELSAEHLGCLLRQAPKIKKEPAEYLLHVARNSIDIIWLAEVLEGKLEEEKLKELYLKMELPLTRVLASMERLGIKVSAVDLKELSKEVELSLADIERSIYAAAGSEFNINSPKQLSVVLFDDLGLKPVKKTKTGYSTNEDVLKRLSAEHEIPALILSYRGLAKLKSTYIDAILALINPATGRVHTTFNQTVTATGRLSSSRPNLQNIPIRGELAARIRGAFIADEGFTLLSADYSQIELRIVAHMADDPTLISAFNNNEDIHTRTASEIFSLDPGEVTDELRRRAKAINFGIIYGMGAYGLAGELDISMGEAQEYIDSYFAHYSAIKAFIDSTVETATTEGAVTTLYGRRRFVPELTSPVDSVRRFGARMAVNTPIQGSAADIIKEAMIKIEAILRKRGLASRMLLQIHDELLFEVASGEEEELKALVTEQMEGVVELSVELKVNINTGLSWSKVEE
ncbi:MAG: DNA polymerase I [Proteobacteria bacterium]|nr:DNA polymerase I [Pseudomonadota bacterium]